MSFRTVGDLAQSFLMNRQSAALKAEVRRLSTELATGRSADLPARLRGDFTAHAALTRSRALAEAQVRALAEARSLAEAAQTALGSVQQAVEAASAGLLAAAGAGTPADLARAGAEARRGFEAAVGALNLRPADRAAFGGAATDRPPLAPAEEILAHLAALTAAAPTAAAAVAAVDAWFDTPGGGFETLAYRGAEADLAPVPLAPGETAAPPPRADDPALRQALKALALGALIGTAAAADPGAPHALARAAGERALAATGGVIGLRTSLGAAEAALAAAEARAAAEVAAGERALADLVATDPYEAATRLEAVQGRLEALQALTVRLARLSLAELLR
jgi:flagellar hook-associated protein 3 FlgL